MTYIGNTVCTKVCTHSLNHAEVNLELRLHYGDFVQANFNMAGKTAGQLSRRKCKDF